MSEGAHVKYTALWLDFLDEESSVRLLSYTLKPRVGLERISSRLLVLDLHPDRTELVDFRCVAQTLLLDGLLSVLAAGRNRYPSLGLRNHLHELLGFTIWVTMDYVLVCRLVEYPQEVRSLVLVN